MGLSDFTAEGQDQKTVQKAFGKLRPFLGPEERILTIVVQQKSTFNPFADCMVLTDRALYLCESTKLGMDMTVDVVSRDALKEIHSSVGSAAGTAKVEVYTSTDTDYLIDHIPIIQVNKLRMYLDPNKKPAPKLDPEPQTKPMVETQTEPRPGLDALQKKIRSLYHRQYISKAEYLYLLKKHRFEE